MPATTAPGGNDEANAERDRVGGRPQPGSLSTPRRTDLSIDDDPDKRYRSDFEAREWQRDMEEAEEQLERNTRSLAEVFIEYMERGDLVEVMVGPNRWTGCVIHVGSELATIEADGRRVDIALARLTAARILEPRTGAGRAYERSAPMTLVARLRELCGASAGVQAVIAGADLAAIVCLVTAVSEGHVEVSTIDGERWVVPISVIGSVMTRTR